MELSQDQYGNYVIQHVLEFAKEPHRQVILKIVVDSILLLSMQKYSSNVIEKCFIFATEKEKAQIVNSIMGKSGDV